MNFSFELSWAVLTGNINQEAMMGMGAIAWAVFGWIAMVRIVIMLWLAALMIISRWRIFKKAWLPGWGAIIPLYNIYLTFKLGGRSGRNVLWILIPPVFVILLLINIFNITKKFWKHWTYGLGIIFLKIIFIPILAFDDSTYLGKKVNKVVVKTPVKIVARPAKRVIVRKPVAKKPAVVIAKPVAKVATTPSKPTAKRVVKRTVTKKK